MGEARPYTRMELNSPGIRPPLDWKRVVATAEQFDIFSEEISATLNARVAELEAKLADADDGRHTALCEDALSARLTLAAAVAAEREACATVAATFPDRTLTPERIAAAIRARGGTP